MTTSRDVVVVGGGPAGAYAAKLMAEGGLRVRLIERTTGPHPKVCGEFLSHEAIFYLQRAGLDPKALGAVPISSVALIRRKTRTSAALPFPALSLSRRILDEALITAARDAGAEIMRGCRVRSITRNGPGWRIDGDGLDVETQDVFLATGKHDIRGWKRPPGLQNDLIGLKQVFSGPPATTGQVELYLFDGGYCGIEPVEGGAVNLSLLVRKGHFARLGGWDGLWDHLSDTSPIFVERMTGVQPVMDRPLSISAIPYGYVRRSSSGPWYLGDQAAVVPSFAGEGISMALHSAHLAARYRLKGGTAATYQHAFARDVRRQVRCAAILSHLLVRRIPQAVLANSARSLQWGLPQVAAATRISKDRLGG